VAGSDPATDGVVYTVDVFDSASVLRKSFAGRAIVQVIPSHDQSYWNLYQNVLINPAFAFQVYVVAPDSLPAPKAIPEGWGKMALTPDGDTMCLSNPGLVDSIPDGQVVPPLQIFEPVRKRIVEWFTDWSLFSDSNWVAAPNDLAVTPDGRWLVILGGAESLRVLYCWDLDNRKMTHTEAWGGDGHAFTNLTVRRER
jgi:hypothetical protein